MLAEVNVWVHTRISMIPTREALRTICQTTAKEIQPMNTRQKIGVGLANAASFSRVAIAAPLLTKNDAEPWTWTNTLEAAAIPASDYADGAIARAFNARTTGGGYIDQYLDKVLMIGLEAKLVARNEMDIEDFVERQDSDQDINTLRTSITTLSNGEVNVDALTPGKRMAVLRFGEKVLCISPLANKLPRARRKFQRFVTKKLLSTREESKQIYKQRYSKWLYEQPVTSQEQLALAA